MSRAICIMGESGNGKTASLRTLDAKSTCIIDCDGKGLAWKGWRSQYNVEAKNYVVTDDQDSVLKIMQMINDKAPHIKVLVIDTLNSIMVADERRRSKDKGYDKWTDLAWSVYDICTMSSKLRDDLTVVLIAHTQTDVDDQTGEKFTRILTNGKKLNKIVLEKYFNTVFLSKRKGDAYVFETAANNSTCKTPMGAFDGDIPNDLQSALDILAEY